MGTVPVAVQNGDLLTIPSRNTSLVCWYFCEHPTIGVRGTVWELDQRSAGQETFALALTRRAGSARFESEVAGGVSLGVDLPFDPYGRWLLISLAHVNTWDAPADELYLSVFDPSSGTTYVSAPTEFAVARGSLVPDIATIGDRFARGVGTSRTAAGICMPAILADALVDGRVAAGGASTVAMSALALKTGLAGHVALANFTACVWSANATAGALADGPNDSRAGIRDGSLQVLDRNRSILAERHQYASGATLRGGVTSVDPYRFGVGGFRVARPAYEATIGAGALPATPESFAELGGANPGGELSPRTYRLARAMTEGKAYERIRVGILANSRAVYPTPYRARLSNGQFLNRSFSTNFIDSGITCQAPVFNNGLIVGRIMPVPWCNWSTPDYRTGGYGVDCEAELPRCANALLGQGAVVAPSVAMRGMQNSTLGSRFGIFSPVATRVPATGYPGSVATGALDNYRGSHATVRLLPGYSARFMVRPEGGLPTSDPLKVTMYLLNHPSSSSVAARAVTTRSQGGTELSGVRLQTPSLGKQSRTPPPEPKRVLAISRPTLILPSWQSEYGSVTVDDTDRAFEGIEPGDMVQLVDEHGSGAAEDEAFLVRDVVRGNSGELTLSYNWLPRKFPEPGDRVTFVKGADIFQKVSVELDPVKAGVWRGLELVAGTDGDGVALWGFAFENPARNGLVTMPIGRSGCGSLIQSARWPREGNAGSTSLLTRIFDELGLDVLVLSTAEQGTGDGQHAASTERVLDIIREESPHTECVIYATGPEYFSEDRVDKSDIGRKFDVCVAMQLAAANKGVPMTSFFFDHEYSSSAFGRLQSGVDTTEGATHPGTVLDVSILAKQLLSLPRALPLVQPDSFFGCPSATAEFFSPRSPLPGVSWRWEIELAQAPGTYEPLADGPLVRNGVQVAVVDGAASPSLRLTTLQAWHMIGWPVPGRGNVRLVEVTDGHALTSDPIPVALCPTDLDCSGGVDGDDVLLFFSFWDRSDPRADFDGTTSIDGDDVIGFFASWDQGC
jgi:hypothetical protein